MGREIRLVPAGWEHPKRRCPHWPKCEGSECFQPMFDRTFKKQAKEWKDSLFAWERGDRPSYCSADSRGLEFWEYEGAPPDREFYVPYEKSDCSWLQMYETVSEGTPVTPAFKTDQELIDYLVKNGDRWDQQRANEEGGTIGWSRTSAEKFVKSGYAPSMIIAEGKIYSPRDMGDLKSGEDK